MGLDKITENEDVIATESNVDININWSPTTRLRWKEGEWNASLCDFDKVLEQLWISNDGEEKWLEVPFI